MLFRSQGNKNVAFSTQRRQGGGAAETSSRFTRQTRETLRNRLWNPRATAVPRIDGSPGSSGNTLANALSDCLRAFSELICGGEKGANCLDRGQIKEGSSLIRGAQKSASDAFRRLPDAPDGARAKSKSRRVPRRGRPGVWPSRCRPSAGAEIDAEKRGHRS